MKISLLTLLLVSTSAWAETQTVTLDIPGMTCAACPITIKKALTRVEGVAIAEVNYKTRAATVTFDDVQTNAETIRQATGNIGYPSTIRVQQ